MNQTQRTLLARLFAPKVRLRCDRPPISELGAQEIIVLPSNQLSLPTFYWPKLYIAPFNFLGRLHLSDLQM